MLALLWVLLYYALFNLSKFHIYLHICTQKSGYSNLSTTYWNIRFQFENISVSILPLVMLQGRVKNDICYELSFLLKISNYNDDA